MSWSSSSSLSSLVVVVSCSLVLLFRYGMGVVMVDEREELRSIFANGVAAIKQWEAGTGDCWTAFQWWNSVWQDDSGGGLPGE
jgi:hypothetical protein